MRRGSSIPDSGPANIGKHEDIEHATPEELQGDEWDQYGRISGFLSRPRA